MNEKQSQDIDVQELKLTLDVIEKLAANPDVFNKAYDAYLEEDEAKFEVALNKAGIEEHCHVVCRFFCKKHCTGLCLKFCPSPKGEVSSAEILDFVKAVTPVLQNETTVKRFFEIMVTEDVKEWNEMIKKHNLGQFCYQLCILLCSWRCKEKCRKICPAKPLITNVGSIPVNQINALGYGNGASIPIGFVGAPQPALGYGDHPFGGLVCIKGIFNMPTATEYLVEVSSTGPGGPYNPILVAPQVGYDTNPAQPPPPPFPPPPPPPPWQVQRTRTQSGGPDPGWFKINEITDSEGGRLTTGEKQLLMWPTTVPDGVYYLRLRVRDGLNTRVSSPQVVRLDNTGPFPLPRPTITLQLQKQDGTRVPLKCGKVKKGDGLIVVTVHAYDPNMSNIAVTARGNSGLSVPVVDVAATPLSKTYNGNIADQGYLVPTEFLWSPWNDPNIVPCCYVIYVEVWDRTIINNFYSGGHYNSGWEAIEIGF